jgi:hypothetical protein
MHVENVKETALQLIDQLPDNTSWEKLLYALQVRRDIEAGLRDVDEGRVLSSNELRAVLGIAD